MPSEKDKDGKWFIRPHHLESLTQHTASLKDDVLNTRYFSNYNQEWGKDNTPSDAEQAISDLRRLIDDLKSKQMGMDALQGKDMTDEYERLKK